MRAENKDLMFKVRDALRKGKTCACRVKTCLCEDKTGLYRRVDNLWIGC